MRISDWSSDVCSSDLEEQLRRSISVPGFAFLPKPFSVQQLGEAVRDALARAQEKREREGACGRCSHPKVPLLFAWNKTGTPTQLMRGQRMFTGGSAVGSISGGG